MNYESMGYRTEFIKKTDSSSTFQTCRPPPPGRKGNPGFIIEKKNLNLHYISIGLMTETKVFSKLPLAKDKAFLTFLGQKPTFEIWAEKTGRLRSPYLFIG